MRTALKKFQNLWVFLYYCLVSVFMTWPLTLHLRTSVIGGMGDNIYFVWLIRWYQKVFLEGQGHPFFNPMMNYPQGWNLSTTETSLASALPGVPFSAWLGPIAGYNIAMLLTFVLSGFFMYLWVRSLTKSNAAALLAGTLYAFSPYHIAHFVVGHLNLCGIEWFPLYFWGLHNLLNSKKKFDLKSVLLTGLPLGLIAFTSMYYLYMTLIFSLIFVAGYLCFTRFSVFRNKFFWIEAASAIALCVPFVYFALRPFINLAQSGTLVSRSIEYASMYSASPTDFFLPSSDHFLLGALFSKWFDRSLWNESSLYIGLIALVFAVVAITGQKKSQHRWFIWTALIVIVASFILALGINLHWNNQAVVWQIPDFLQGLFKKSETLIYLPSAWLFNHLPFFDKMRSIMRFGFFVLLFMPILAGIGFARIQQKLKTKAQVFFTLGILLLALFDFYPGSYAASLTQPQPRAVDLWLSDQPGQGAVVQMPFSASSDQAQIYYTLFHQKPYIGGFFNANQPVQYLEIQPILDGFPDQSSVQLLQDLGVEFIVVDRNTYNDYAQISHEMEALGLTLLTSQDGQDVFTFTLP